MSNAILASLSPRERAVYDLVAAAADRGEPAPTNRAIMTLLRGATPSIGPRTLARLERKGAIRVEAFSCGRIITIMRTGRSTRAPESRQPHWRQLKAAAARIAAPQAIGAPPRPVLDGAAPAPSFGIVRDDYGALAEEIQREAFRRDQALSAFLSRLVGLGWHEYARGRTGDAAKA
ncbi:helix-turn-helix domain-containing protein [Flavisphingomonas formosensis]|uniref:hypothetical protein n=1 Tax=Flavisphingomonas formosensis TaxID=861534 RepID=UPI0012F716C2|nr:hypothetical protein [Sphingomonas formosensis]